MGVGGSVAQSCLTLLGPTDCSLPGSSAHGIFQARILEGVAISYSRGSSQPSNRTQVFRVFCTGRWILHHWATWEPLLPYRLLRNREQRSLACTVLTPNLCPICSHNVCSSNVYYHREAIRGTHPQPCPGSTEPHPQDHQGSSWSPFLRNLSYLCLITPLC